MILKRTVTFLPSSSTLIASSTLRRASLLPPVGTRSSRFFAAQTNSNFEVIELESADDFEQYAQSHHPVIVDFYGQ